jgi:hypothetical protein
VTEPPAFPKAGGFVFLSLPPLAVGGISRTPSLHRHGRAWPGHPRLACVLLKTWIPGTRPGMTLYAWRVLPPEIPIYIFKQPRLVVKQPRLVVLASRMLRVLLSPLARDEQELARGERSAARRNLVVSARPASRLAKGDTRSAHALRRSIAAFLSEGSCFRAKATIGRRLRRGFPSIRAAFAAVHLYPSSH